MKRSSTVGMVALIMVGVVVWKVWAPDRAAPQFDNPKTAAQVCKTTCAQFNGWSGKYRYTNPQQEDLSLCECAS